MVSLENKLLSQLVVLGLFLCLCSALCGIPAVDATVVWTDNFNDGDHNGWTIQDGDFTASGNRLQSTAPLENGISRPSTVATGTWNFTLHWVNIATTGGGWIYFMAYDLNPAINNIPDEGYCVGIGTEGWGLTRWEGGGQTIMDGYAAAPYDGTYDICISRDATGNIRVYIDNILRMERQNTVHSTSTHFFYRVLDSGQWIDDIWVDNEPLDDGGDGNGDNGGTTTPVIPGFPGIAIAVGIMSALTIGVLYRRRNSRIQPN